MRKFQRKRKSSLVIRNKTRPIGQTKFNIELRIQSVMNMPVILNFRGFMVNAVEIERYNERKDMIYTLKNIIGGGYKLIQHRKSNSHILTKILLTSEADMFMLAMAHPTMIEKAYRYVDPI